MNSLLSENNGNPCFYPECTLVLKFHCFSNKKLKKIVNFQTPNLLVSNGILKFCLKF